MARQAREIPIDGGGRYKRWRMEDGKPLILRILPPMKSLLDVGDGRSAYASFDTKLFISGADPLDETKTKSWCIASMEESEFRERERVVIVHDPIIEMIRPYMTKRDAIQKAGEDQKIDKAELAKQVKPYSDFLRHNSISGKWSFYAMDRNGEFGVLELNNTMKKTLMEKAKAYAAEHDNENPFGIEKGIFWVFTRTGKRFPITDTLDIYRTKVTASVGGKDVQVETIETHNFTEELEVLALRVLPDFAEERARIGYSKAVHEQIAAAKGDLKKIRDIMVAADKAKGDAARAKAQAASAAPVVTPTFDDPAGEVEETAAEPEVAATSTEMVAAAANTETAVEPEPEVPAEDDEEAKLMAQLAAMKASKASKAAAQAAVATTVAPAAGKPGNNPAVKASTMDQGAFDQLFKKKTAAATTA
jgi:hypothetical protein